MNAVLFVRHADIVADIISIKTGTSKIKKGKLLVIDHFSIVDLRIKKMFTVGNM